jgi:predicted metal-dependent HD superfamily phosphohydrolase
MRPPSPAARQPDGRTPSAWPSASDQLQPTRPPERCTLACSTDASVEDAIDPEPSIDGMMARMPGAFVPRPAATPAQPMPRPKAVRFRSTLVPIGPAGLAFSACGAALGLEPRIVTRWRDEVVGRYCELERHYHTLSHVEAMLDGLTQHRALVHDVAVVQLAIFFHDVVYAPRRHDNELASMALFAEFADEARLADATRDAVLHLIERTQHHSAERPEHPDLPLFLDLDLEVLSRPPAAYRAYAAEVRLEYAHVPQLLFCDGRARVLGALLERPRLYSTAAFFAAHEAQARQNVAQERAHLEQQLQGVPQRVALGLWRAAARARAALMA